MKVNEPCQRWQRSHLKKVRQFVIFAPIGLSTDNQWVAGNFSYQGGTVYKKPVNDRVSSSVLARLKTLEILRTAIQVSAIRKPSKWSSLLSCPASWLWCRYWHSTISFFRIQGFWKMLFAGAYFFIKLRNDSCLFDRPVALQSPSRRPSRRLQMERSACPPVPRRPLPATLPVEHWHLPRSPSSVRLSRSLNPTQRSTLASSLSNHFLNKIKT